MRNTPNDLSNDLSNDISQEPWLGRMSQAPQAADDGFVRRVMAAHDAQQDEPWLDWLADNRIPADATFAARVAGRFADLQAKRRVAGRMVRPLAALAASAALGSLIWLAVSNGQTPAGSNPQNNPKNNPMVAMNNSQPTAPGAAPASLEPLLIPDPQAAKTWFSNQTRQVATTVNFTRMQASALVSEYAVPLRITGLLMGLAMPTRHDGDTGGAPQPHSHRNNQDRPDFARLAQVA